MSTDTAKPFFDRVALIGIGLIGSSILHVVRRDKLAGHVVGIDSNPEVLAVAERLGIVDETTTDPAGVAGADLVVVATPVGAFASVGEAMGPHLSPGAIVTDTGSVKQSVVRDLGPYIPAGVHFVPGHPIAGTEYSGPEAGFATLFEGRWCLLTPPPGTDPEAVAKIEALWHAAGAMTRTMDPAHHDQVLAVVSHLPHLIAFTIVGTATDLGESIQQEVITFAASGFRDFTRIAASDPIMWRDIFLNNREALLDMAGRLEEDIARLKRFIRWGEGDEIVKLITRTREIRRKLIDAKQA